MKTKITFLIALFIMVVLLNTTKASTVYTIQEGSYYFSPDTLYVHVGDTIKWVWMSGSHTSTSIKVPTGAATWNHPMNSASSDFEIQLTVAGEYDFHCNIHPSMMHGAIFVAPASGITSYNNASHFVHLYPNPFLSNLSMSFTLKESETIKISIYDLTGKIVKVLANSNFEKGDHVISWDGKNETGENVNHGLYFYMIEMKGQSKASGKIIYGS
jgi:plastocyanin